MQFHIHFRAMGCHVEIRLETDADGQAILEALPERFDNLEDILSRFRPDSELMRLNARTDDWVAVSPILFDNIIAAKQGARLTEGRFNPLILLALINSGYDRSFEEPGHTSTVQAPIAVMDWRAIQIRQRSREVYLPAGSGIDLGGTAKGWTAQHLGDELAQYGPGLINIGGDIYAWGAPQGQPGWQIDLADASDPDGYRNLASLWLKDAAVATSGIDYRHWKDEQGQINHHIINPATGRPATTDVLAATVIHPHAPTAEAYTKALLLMGSDTGLTWLNHRWYADGLVIRHDQAVLATSNFTSYFQEGVLL